MTVVLRSLRLPLLLVAAGLVLLAPGSGTSAVAVLEGQVGPGFTIALRHADGRRVETIDPGTFTVVIHDDSEGHNFHLNGPSVNQLTDVDTTGTVTWQVTFVEGRYTYVCDPHRSSMSGQFTVGNPPAVQPKPTPKPKTLQASVGPGRKITLTTVGGARLVSTSAGRYRILVSDRSARDNFHLLGAGVNRKTGVAFRGARTWTVTLKAGKVYSYRSDKRPSLRGTLVVLASRSAHH